MCQAPRSLFRTHQAGDISRPTGRKPRSYHRKTTQTASARGNRELEPGSHGPCRVDYVIRVDAVLCSLDLRGQDRGALTERSSVGWSFSSTLKTEHRKGGDTTLGKMREGKAVSGRGTANGSQNGQEQDWGGPGCVDAR